MKLPVASIPEDGLELDLREEMVLEGLRFSGPLEIRLRLQRLGRKVIVNGRMTGTAVLPCSRCLEDQPQNIEAEFQAAYEPALRGEPEQEILLSETELDVSRYDGDEIRLDELIREQALLALPLSPVCDDACRGLCTVCGVNRNERDCECRTEEMDPRFRILKKLKGETDGESHQ